MNVAAGAGSAAVCAIRTKSFLEKVNQEYFAPRGLKASVCKDEELRNKIGYFESLPEVAENAEAMTLGRRQVEALGKGIAPLEFDVPPPSEQTSALDKMSAKQMEWRLKKLEKKTQKQKEKEQRKAAEFAGSNPPAPYGGSSGYQSGYDSNWQEAQKLQEERLKEQEKMEKKKEKAEKKDNKRIGKMEYIIIEVLDPELQRL